MELFPALLEDLRCSGREAPGDEQLAKRPRDHRELLSVVFKLCEVRAFTVKLADWISMPDSSVIRTVQLPGVTLKWDQVTQVLPRTWIGRRQTRRPFLIQWCAMR
jgi:hypothetical protein